MRHKGNQSNAAPIKKVSLSRAGYPVILNGRKGGDNITPLRSPFEMAFSEERNASAWKACGAVPLTRKVLEDPYVRHE